MAVINNNIVIFLSNNMLCSYDTTTQHTNKHLRACAS